MFQADQCRLRDFDAADFSAKMRGRKLIMIGDSIMRLHFYSLACLMRGQVRSLPFLSGHSPTGRISAQASLFTVGKELCAHRGALCT